MSNEQILFEVLNQMFGNETKQSQKQSNNEDSDTLLQVLADIAKETEEFSQLSLEEMREEILRGSGIDPTPAFTQRIEGTDLNVNIYKGDGINGVMRELEGHMDIAPLIAMRGLEGESNEHNVTHIIRNVLQPTIIDLYKNETDPKQKEKIRMLLCGVFDLMNFFYYQEDAEQFGLEDENLETEED